MFTLFKKRNNSDIPNYGDIKPKGFKTYQNSDKLSREEWNKHMEELFTSSRRSSNLHASEIIHQNIKNFK